jgi:hypothetical protein
MKVLIALSSVLESRGQKGSPPVRVKAAIQDLGVGQASVRFRDTA